MYEAHNTESKDKVILIRVISKKIKQYREYKNYSQEFMAVQLKISQSQYSRIEAGQDITVSRLTQIVKVLGFNGIEDFFSGLQTTFNITHNKNASGITVNQNSPDYRDEYIVVLKEQITLLKQIINQNKK